MKKPKMAKGMQFKSANVKEKPMMAGKPSKRKKKAPSDMAMLQQKMPR
jgi:hypothetical protein